MLTINEKEYLYEIIASIIGDDITIKSYSHSFNEMTVDVVEKMISAEAKCNKTIKRLLTDLATAGGFVAKGWLKKALKMQKKLTKKSEFKGYGCLVSVKSRWKSQIISSAI